MLVKVVFSIFSMGMFGFSAVFGMDESPPWAVGVARFRAESPTTGSSRR